MSANGTHAQLSGACLCGAVSVRVRPTRPELHACHCEMCRTWTGVALVEIDVAPKDFEASGPIKRFTSSDWAERAWCDACGTTLWYKLTIPGREHFAVSAGLFPDAGNFPLTKEIYIDRKPAGYAFAGDHLRQTKQQFEASLASASQGETQ
ncbi:GFA family protein [Tropicimonas marinistellae]|uniref:GFA family protein n=1 Tax=Tropicimonas marinistellae TaxID=1739787 RepID=UPI001F47F783|nr:GFA family protein [Tropicimonas marinistellae]